MFFRQTVAMGCLVAGSGFFYATMCDPASIGALNMHFLFALAVVGGTPFLVRIFHVMWDDFILVSIALVAHPLIERKIDELDDRIRQRSPSSDQSRTKAKE